MYLLPMSLKMEVSNIYGPISNNTEVILAIGNYNSIHGLLTSVTKTANDVLQMKPLADITSPMILELVISYTSDNKFTLAIKGTDKFIGVEDARLISEVPEIRNVTACISSIKTYFTLDFSIVDRLPRSKILSGVLYSLRTIVGEQQYVVTWPIKDFANGDLMIFLPTTWYEREEQQNTCQKVMETPILLDKLNQLRFRGYTNAKWCEQLPTLTHCTEDSNCGQCLGNCHHKDHICYPDNNGNFVCALPNVSSNENFDIIQASTTATTNANMRTIAAWIVLGAIMVVILLLVWGLSKNNN